MPEPPGNRTIVYTRVSTDKQEREATAESQEREALQFAAAKKLLVARVAHEQHTGAQLHERHFDKLPPGTRRNSLPGTALHKAPDLHKPGASCTKRSVEN